MIDLIIFDKDGTLFDFQATWGVWSGRILDRLFEGQSDAKSAAAKALHYDLDRRVILPQSIVVAGTPMEIAETISGFLNSPAAQLLDDLNAEASRAPQVPVGDLDAILGALVSSGTKLAVMTNDSEAPARVHLSNAGVLDRFDMIVGSNSGFGAKPDPDPLMAIADALGIAPENCLMVGDSLHDLHAGRAAGMKTLAVLTGLASEDVLAPAADHVAASIETLPDLLQAQVFS